VRLSYHRLPDTRSHRGPHPADAELFAPAALPRLRGAVSDLSWLLSRGYATPGALQLVGNRYALEARQRQAVTRSACPDAALARRRSAEVAAEAVAGGTLLIDGYNVLTTIETALGGGVVLLGRDGACRDIAGVHGTWRRVEETVPALRLVGRFLAARVSPARCVWYLDSPVSNSGRLRGIIECAAADAGWDWSVEVIPDVDGRLIAADNATVATADAEIIDGCGRWYALTRQLVRAEIPAARLVDLNVSPVGG
jgi:hypothetical protein